MPQNVRLVDESNNPVSFAGGGAANPYPGADYANSAKQDTSNTSLSSIATSSSAEAAAVGASTDAATASGVNTTVIGALRAIRDKLLGSVAVTGTFWQATQPISAASLPLPTNASQDGIDPGSPPVANGGTGIRGWLGTIAGLLKLGTTTKAAAASVTIATDQGNLEPGGTAITGASMPTGGIGLTGWLSAIWQACTAATPTGTNLIGKVNITATTAGGAQLYVVTPGNTTNAASIKTAAGTVYSLICANKNGTNWMWVHLYDKASAPISTDVAKAVIGVPPGGAVTTGFSSSVGIAFGAGIAIAVTGAAGLADGTVYGGAVGDAVVNLAYA